MMARSCWVGENTAPNENLTIVGLRDAYIHRFPSEFHGAFSDVQCIEKPISGYPNWPLLLDEILRLGSDECTFKILLSLGDPKFSIASFYKQVFKRSQGKCRICSVENINDVGGVEVKFSIEREIKQLSKNWSFGVIWDGKGKNYLVDFIESVYNQKLNGEEFEVIICGPKTELKYEVTFIEAPLEAEELSNISQKKNLIVKSAKNENVCIVHNRYMLDDNFVSSFEDFGYDFEMCIVPQVLKFSGERVPDWVTQASDNVLTKNYWLEYGEFSPFQYCPGGLTIAKKEILEGTPWNELATWNMAEDVELSQRLRDEGLVYKLNHFTTARVLSLRKEIIDDFHPASLEHYYSNVDQYQRVEKKSTLLCKIKNFVKRILSN